MNYLDFATTSSINEYLRIYGPFAQMNFNELKGEEREDVRKIFEQAHKTLQGFVEAYRSYNEINDRDQNKIRTLAFLLTRFGCDPNQAWHNTERMQQTLQSEIDNINTLDNLIDNVLQTQFRSICEKATNTLVVRPGKWIWRNVAKPLGKLAGSSVVPAALIAIGAVGTSLYFHNPYAFFG